MASLPWHKSLNLEALTNSNTELSMDWSKIKEKCVLFRNSCNAKVSAHYFQYEETGLICKIIIFVLLIYSVLNLVCQEFQSIIRRTDVSSRQPVIQAAQKKFFTCIPPMKGLKFIIKQCGISCLLATSRPGTK